MSKNPPKVSIGLPVYNGEKFIKAALDSLLAQTFTDFELIISDNASTDNTEEICRAYAAQDERIRYYRNNSNLGCSRNFNRVFELSVGEYFKWAAYDDLHAPDFLIKCVEILDNHPTVVLCHSHVSLIDENGDFLQNYNIKLNTDSQKPHKRFHELLTKHLCYQCYGLIRASALRKIPPMGSYGTADGILLLRIGLLGQFYEIPEYLFFARTHSQQSLSMFFPNHHLLTKDKTEHSQSILPDFYAYTVWFDSAKKGKILFPHWRILWEYMLSVWLFPLTLQQRLRCHISIYQQLHGTEYLLLQDLFKAAQIICQPWQSYVRKKEHIIP
ncbi:MULTISPECIES: glycosyltransferase family 2 protein [unclassified Nodularia (in: cyanobacteria)]|uniref:glycosyltransferase family 2 protein n=1 Tax=unclassified Nodularia (in: cyanobacteria) TaxID=2656917 RepID=UPI0018820131|nr:MULTISPECIES: glycosyltransferase family 2 protein [unclassified Nodularia (in: cyanobacteria)]MBE9201833.1 glycosyltransferase family 2 protein [Nodularia sp. LEGE 06071]MCC2693258.1 glycosyltransferase family 2 protein [Nodularia sp. LEGE 04288]